MKAHVQKPAQAGRRAFTLVELMASMAVLAMLMLACTGAISTVQRTFTQARSKAQQFSEARLAFETITRNLSQATLNTYWDYYYQATGSNEPPANSTAPPNAYVRQSELQFKIGPASDLVGSQASAATHPGHAVFFQAPLGLTSNGKGLGNLLNARGYAIQFGGDDENRPPFLNEYEIPVRRRYRLVEYRPPAENSSVSQGNTIYTKPADWFRQDQASSTRVVAENIILLVLSPRVSDESAAATNKDPGWIAPRYDYDSRDADNSTAAIDRVTVRADGTAVQNTQHLLPPLVVVTMVALDEVSAARWAESNNDSAVSILSKAGASFTNASQHAADLASLERYLSAQKLNYRVFSTTVSLRNARWDDRSS